MQKGNRANGTRVNRDPTVYKGKMPQVTHPDVKLFHKNVMTRSIAEELVAIAQSKTKIQRMHTSEAENKRRPKLQKNRKYTKLKGKYGGKNFQRATVFTTPREEKD